MSAVIGARSSISTARGACAAYAGVVRVVRGARGDRSRCRNVADRLLVLGDECFPSGAPTGEELFRDEAFGAEVRRSGEGGSADLESVGQAPCGKSRHSPW
ncbi:hypothetical protein GCM10012279_54970 [Micromonospora yangpuensis]|nr:hypothetical protein GCM10012279_54970 [Micromonospora yangpuensis]